MVFSNLLKDEFNESQMERLFTSFNIFWQVTFYVLLALFLMMVIVWFLDSYAKRKYKQKLSMRNKRVIENYNSIDCFYLFKLKRIEKQRKGEK